MKNAREKGAFYALKEGIFSILFSFAKYNKMEDRTQGFSLRI
jgi:hypothetical protein